MVFDLQWSISHDGININTSYDRVAMFLCCSSLILVLYTWVEFFRLECGRQLDLKKIESLVLIIPFIVALILVITTYWTDWIFTIDENGYARGPHFWTFMFCVFLPPVIVTIESFYLAIKAELKIEKRKYLTLGFFIFPLLIMDFTQYLWYNLPGLCLGITISMVAISLSLQNQLITKDQMTGLNNLFHMEKYLLTQFKKHRSEGTDNLYVAILDMDAFKPIVEKYGHTEGANVICMVSGMIMKACGRANCFSARYGNGNKYVLICEDRNTLKGVCDRFENLVEEKNKDLPYVIHFSIGIASINDKHETFSDLLDDADDNMAIAKKAYYEKIDYKRNK